MSAYSGPEISNDGLILCLDAANQKSYPGTGTTWFDISGNGNNATKGGSQSPTYPAHNASGYFTFSGGITGNNYSRFQVTTPALNSITVIAFHYSTQSNGHVLRHSTDDFQIGPNGYTAGTSYNNVQTGGNRSSNLNTWVCDTLTFSGTDLIGYRNGLSVGTASRTSTSIAGGTLNIGTRNDAHAAHYVGNISFVAIYNRVLSAQEVQQNFNALRSRYDI